MDAAPGRFKSFGGGSRLRDALQRYANGSRDVWRRVLRSGGRRTSGCSIVCRNTLANSYAYGTFLFPHVFIRKENICYRRFHR